jgi:hypothetical protein
MGRSEYVLSVAIGRVQAVEVRLDFVSAEAYISSGVPSIFFVHR